MRQKNITFMHSLHENCKLMMLTSESVLESIFTCMVKGEKEDTTFHIIIFPN